MNSLSMPIPAIIGSVTSLVVIGFIIGTYGTRFVTKNEFKDAIDRIHGRMDEVLNKINDLALKVAKFNGIK